MAQRNIVIHAKAYDSYRRKIAWYYLNCGVSYITTFDADIWRTFHVLASMPSIGKTIKHTSSRTYAEYVSHPLVVIRYWYNNEEIHIMDLIYTRKKR